ncbi:hypothetical protein B1B_08931 [mine drainage metagenome]|uniref:Transposase IS30-like HTH domain-containing protein n=1 Tax=mine drainage metagenome TaxID=410659 RepID=T1AJW3_9ZZZZ
MGKIYEQLSIEERTMIETQLERGVKPAAIAAELGRSASTLSRELRRKHPAHHHPAMTGSGSSPGRQAASPATVADGVPIFRLTIAFDE